MHRLPQLCAVLALTLTLAACGGTKSPTSDAPGDSGAVVFSLGAAGGAPSDQPEAATAVPTPPQSTGLRLDDLTYARVGTNGNVTFQGVVVNSGVAEAQIVKISVDLYDGSGRRISRVSFSNPSLPILQPGEATRWQGQAAQLVGEWQEVRGTVAVTSPNAAP